MAQVADLVGCGIAPLAARHLGDTIANGLTATGSTAADALAIGQNTVLNYTTVGSGTGAILPTTATSEHGIVFMYNGGSNALTVYPATGETINATTSFSVTNAKGAFFYRVASKAWVAVLSA